MGKDEERQVTSVKVLPSVWKKAKVAAIQRDVTLSEFLERAIENYLKAT